MKTVWIKPYNHERYYNNFFSIDKHLNPFYGFDKKVSKYGVKLKVLKPDCAWKPGETIICADVPYPWDLGNWNKLLQNGRDNNILFCFDSPLVVPFNHWNIINNIFHEIYTYNDDMVDRKDFIKFHLPQVEPDKEPDHKTFPGKKLLVMINSKKSSLSPLRLLSPYRTDYYKNRLKLIEYLNEHHSEKFDLFGYNWDQPDRFSLKERLFGFDKFKVYRGIVSDKLATLSRYKFAFAIENTSTPGYITEKIFDCFWARVVPIYLGSPNIEKYIPTSCYVDLRRFSSFEKILEFIESMKERTYEGYLLSIDKFMNSIKTKELWFGEEFLENFLKAVDNK